jgi:hypothetical protein
VVYFDLKENRRQYDTQRISLGLVSEVILPPDDEPADAPDGNGAAPDRR